MLIKPDRKHYTTKGETCDLDCGTDDDDDDGNTKTDNTDLITGDIDCVTDAKLAMMNAN